MKIFVGKAEGRHFSSKNKRFRDWFHVIFKEFWKVEWVGKLTATSDTKCINCLKRTSPENKPHLHGDKPLLTAPWSRAAAHLTQENQSLHAKKSLPVFLAQKIFFLFNTAFLGDKCCHHLGEATMFSWLHNFVIRNSHWIPLPNQNFEFCLRWHSTENDMYVGTIFLVSETLVVSKIALFVTSYI